MKVKEVMTSNAKACTPTTNLAEAAGFMWDADCGILPVVTDGGKVVGLITDRDICMAAALKGRNLSHIAVEEVISGEVHSVDPEDDIRTALDTMKDRKVRRLPVTDSNGLLLGILSLNDMIFGAKEFQDKKAKDLTYADIISTYKVICEHPIQVRQAQAAAART